MACGPRPRIDIKKKIKEVKLYVALNLKRITIKLYLALLVGEHLPVYTYTISIQLYNV